MDLSFLWLIHGLFFVWGGNVSETIQFIVLPLLGGVWVTVTVGTPGYQINTLPLHFYQVLGKISTHSFFLTAF